MSTTITGVAASFTTGSTFTETTPADGDTANAASVNGAFQKEADATEWLRTIGSKSLSISGPWDFAGTNDTTAPRTAGAAFTTDFALVDKWDTGQGFKVRDYRSIVGGVRTVNAEWYDSGGGAMKWRRDDNAQVASRLVQQPGYFFFYGGPLILGDNFIDGSWVQVLAVETGGPASLLGDFESTAGKVTGHTGVVATTGNVQATAGQVIATGTPSGSSGPGVCSAKRYYGPGTAIASIDITMGTNAWHDGTATIVGTDARGIVTVASGSTNPQTIQNLSFPFKNGTWTTAPIVLVSYVNGSSSGLWPPLYASATATTLTIGASGATTDNQTYEIAYWCIG